MTMNKSTAHTQPCAINEKLIRLRMAADEIGDELSLTEYRLALSEAWVSGDLVAHELIAK